MYPRNAMFYITAHTVTKNQFSNADNANELANNPNVPCPICIDIPPTSNPHPARLSATFARAPIILLPNELNPFQKDQKFEKNKELHDIFIASGLRWIVNNYRFFHDHTFFILSEFNLMAFFDGVVDIKFPMIRSIGMSIWVIFIVKLGRWQYNS